MKKIKVVICEPGKRAQVVSIDRSLDTYQEIVDGYIEAVYPFNENVAIVCNDEGKLSGLPLNRGMRDEDGQIYDIICGTFFIVGLGQADFKSLTDKQAEKYRAMFDWPEHFTRMNNSYFAIPYNPEG